MQSPCSDSPKSNRPHFITIYYSEPDHEGHQFGPDAPETKAAVLKVDALVGRLKAALDKTGLPIDLVVLSDHGMGKVEDGWITLDKLPISPDLTPLARSSMRKRRKTGRASTANSKRHRHSSSYTAARMCPPASTTTRIPARVTR